MFRYFGYGSNMSLTALRAKGVTPLRGRPARLRGWRLTFNIPDFFQVEGGTGNIEPCEGSTVHGVLYAFRDAVRHRLDELEALGVSYDRVERRVETYDGEEVLSNVYVGLPSRLREGYKPSRRYLRILVSGAREMGLDPDYVRELERIETWPEARCGPFRPTTPDPRQFTLASLASSPMHTSLAGHVFDMSQARREHEYLQRLLAGTDVTVFFLQRMDGSHGGETLEDVAADRISPEQRQYLNNYLHEFDREYRHVGTIRYDGFRGQPSVRLHRDHTEILARRVLREAVETNAELGHENYGFLSESQGFMPIAEPRQSLPAEYACWDQIAGDLPAQYTGLTLRRTLDAMPVLPADRDHLPEDDLLRAGSVLAMLSHAYYYVEPRPPERLPDSLSVPWAEVRRRLGREQEVLSYVDLIVYNWRFIDPDRPDPMRAENLRLLTPTVDTKEERTFYLVQTEILAQCSPIIGAVVRAQEAVARGDPDGVADELRVVIGCLQRVVRESLLKINPNPYGPNHVDPVIWAKTVAPFAVPFAEGIQGPSGTSSPIFNLLDSFFGRRRHDTFLGKEIRSLRRGYPRFWRQFLEAIENVSVADYVKRAQCPLLTGLWKEAADVYAGDHGFLGRHRMKVYGYLELAFKVGRSVTIGGFAGMFRDRTWDQVDSELEYARVERTESFPHASHLARLRDIGSPSADTPPGVRHVTLDVEGSGLRYEPGDRCGILPTNDGRLVSRTLEALAATGDELIELTDEWRDAVRHRPNLAHATELPLIDVLRFGRIRPVVPRVAEALHAATQNPELLHAIEKQTASRWELWDLIELLARDGYDPTRLWSAVPSSPEHICHVLPPETFRMYSIASVMHEAASSADQLHLTVGCIRYDESTVDGEAVERRGTASNYLADLGRVGEEVPVFVNHPPRFGLPADPAVPVVLFGAGTGISPFRSFLLQRARQGAGESWLFFATRTRDYVYYRDELAELVARGHLHLRVALSREDSQVRVVSGDDGRARMVFEPGRSAYIQDLMADEDTARELWRLLRSRDDGGEGAHLYVCGRSRFARSVRIGLEELFARFQPGGDGERTRAARLALRQMVGEGRYMQEIFTDARSWNVARTQHRVSDIALRNDDEAGYWLVLDGLVYDITEFLHLHPGGFTVLKGYAGLDGSPGFQRAHAHQSEVQAMLELYEIGAVHRPDFAQRTVTVVRDGVEKSVALAGIYRAWVETLYLVVEMQNALRYDYGLQRGVTCRDDPVEPRSLYKLQRCFETHRRFRRNYEFGLASGPLPDLWELSNGLFAQVGDFDWMRRSMSAIRESESMDYARGALVVIEEELADVVRGGQGCSDPRYPRLLRVAHVMEELDSAFLASVKGALRAGVGLFETHAARLPDEAPEQLMSTLSQLPSVLERYYEDLRERLQIDGWSPSSSRRRRATGAEEKTGPLAVAHSTPLWLMQEDHENAIVLITRSATPIDSIEELVRENEVLIDLMRHRGYGIVVDMRQAPPRNDPEFEGAMRKLRLEIARRYERVAVLLVSSQGVLQVNRLGRQEGATTFATKSRAAAITFASGRPIAGGAS